MVLRLVRPRLRLAMLAAGLGMLFASSCTTPGPLVTAVPATSAPGPAVATPVATRVPAGPTRTPLPRPTAVDQVPIDISGRYTHVTITPRHVARILVSDAPVQILVRYPGPIKSVEPDVKIVQPSTVRWTIEIDEPPDANTLAFSLLGEEPGLMSLEIKSTGAYATVRFALSASAPGAGTPGFSGAPAVTGIPGTPDATPEPAGGPGPVATGTPGSATVVVGTAAPGARSSGVQPTPSVARPARAEGRTVSMADNGTSVVIRAGERFLLSLGEGYDWTVAPVESAMLSRVVNVLTVRGSQGLYEAHRPGQTQLTATGDPACRKARPPCMMPSRQFQVQVVVQ